MSSFVFRGGQFLPCEPVYAGLPDAECADVDSLLRKLDFTHSQTVGCEHGLHYELWHTDEPSLKWLVVFSDTSYFCEIVCDSWPDLIELLAKLSPTVLAALRKAGQGA
jgi:hypothetical protein